jgi:5,10-methylenetetrahydromethanopterin reductase
MVDREGLGGPEDLAIIGDEATCAARLDELVAAGATTLAVSDFATNTEGWERIRVFLASRI